MRKKLAYIVRKTNCELKEKQIKQWQIIKEKRQKMKRCR